MFAFLQSKKWTAEWIKSNLIRYKCDNVCKGDILCFVIEILDSIQFHETLIWSQKCNTCDCMIICACSLLFRLSVKLYVFMILSLWMGNIICFLRIEMKQCIIHIRPKSLEFYVSWLIWSNNKFSKNNPVGARSSAFNVSVYNLGFYGSLGTFAVFYIPLLLLGRYGTVL